jgi:hypothetical protein
MSILILNLKYMNIGIIAIKKIRFISSFLVITNEMDIVNNGKRKEMIFLPLIWLLS